MRFDSNQAWNEAVAAVSANREVLLTLAGVFVALPQFVIQVLLPQPEPAAGTSAQAALAMLAGYFREVGVWLVLAGLIAEAGRLAVLALITDRARPTVGEAITHGLRALPTAIGAQVLVGIAAGFVLGLAIALIAATRSALLGVLVGVPLVAVLIHVSVRLSLALPVVVAEGTLNPVAALRRSWELTRGNTGRLLLFFVLLGLAFAVIVIVTQALVGALAGLIAGGEAARIVVALVLSTVEAALSAVMVAVIAAVHRQLSGGDRAGLAEAFQ